MSAVKTITRENFDQEIKESKTPVCIDFYADWCAPCRKMMPIVEEVAKKFTDRIKVCKINIDKNSEIASEFNVMSIPSFFIIKDGEKKASQTGASSKEELENFINKNIL